MDKSTGNQNQEQNQNLPYRQKTENKRFKPYRGGTDRRTDNKINPKTRIKTPDSRSREASQAAGAAPTLRYGPAGDSAPQLRLKAAGMSERFPFGPSPRLEHYNKNQQDVFMLHINSCQGEAPGPLERPERKTMRAGWGVALCLSNTIK